MQIAFSQINSALGDIKGNAEKIMLEIQRAADLRADLIVFPEFALLGYLPEDLLDQHQYIRNCEKQLQSLARKIPANIHVLLGMPTFSKNGRLHNSAVHFSKGKVRKYCHKTLFPNYDVFDEARYFEPGDPKKNILRIKGKRILVTICEDLWLFHPRYKDRYPNIYKEINKKDIDYVVNLSGSPYTKVKMQSRLKMLQEANQYFKKPLLYVNLVGAQDSLIFDGRSMALDKQAKILTQSMAFQEDFNMVNFETGEAGKRHHINIKDTYAEIHKALVLGVRDFIHKNSFAKVHLGLSGGIDSALVACLAVDALGAANVHCLAMPSQFNVPESLDLARVLCKNLGCSLQVIPIDDYYKSFSKNLSDAFEVKDFSLMHENLQSRIRGLILMAYSNAHPSMLLSTGNKSELAVGYATLYGDMNGGLAPIGDLLKTEVYALSRWYNQDHELIPQRIIDRPPSAELRHDQRDQDSLPDYHVLDKMVEDYICKDKKPRGEYKDWFLKQVKNSEFKRRQAPPTLKISERAFGRGRRYPIALK